MKKLFRRLMFWLMLMASSPRPKGKRGPRPQSRFCPHLRKLSRKRGVLVSRECLDCGKLLDALVGEETEE